MTSAELPRRGWLNARPVLLLAFVLTVLTVLTVVTDPVSSVA